MITRSLQETLQLALTEVPIVALLGPRQVGKTTLARAVSAQAAGKPCVWLDMELDSDLAKLEDAEAYLRRFENTLLIIDEVQRKPDLFPVLRSLVDQRKSAGEKTAQFLLLGSASKDLLQQSSETLAGRIRYLELSPFSIVELARANNEHDKTSALDMEKLWFRGGFPDSYLAPSDDASWNWRHDFVATYLERDLPQLGVQVPATRMKRFWTMLAHLHGQQLNLSATGKSLDVSHTTIRSYLDLLTDFYMIRQIPAWSGNAGKRLVKSPKLYLRDTGLLHQLLTISNFEALLGHPISGLSWEGFVVENIIRSLSSKWLYSYYRTATGDEIDLVLETPAGETWAVEIKRSSAPKLQKGFYVACDDIKADRKFVVYSGTERYPMAQGAEAIGVVEFNLELNPA
ncbi:MAG: ATP-binding protein [Gammaproteobacteria bacterium]|nr:ATP-binding protein [Gammaproteobacteria bacterium]